MRKNTCDETDLVEELLVVNHSEPNKCEPFGNLQRRLVGFLRPSRLCESDGMVASVRFRWNSKARVDSREFISDITLHQ